MGRCPGSSARRAWRNARPVVKSRRRHAGTEPPSFVVKFHAEFIERFCLESASKMLVFNPDYEAKLTTIPKYAFAVFTDRQAHKIWLFYCLLAAEMLSCVC